MGWGSLGGPVLAQACEGACCSGLLTSSLRLLGYRCANSEPLLSEPVSPGPCHCPCWVLWAGAPVCCLVPRPPAGTRSSVSDPGPRSPAGAQPSWGAELPAPVGWRRWGLSVSISQ